MNRLIRSALAALFLVPALAFGAVAVGATGSTSTSSASITAGFLTIKTGPSDFSYSATLTGQDQTVTSSGFTVTVEDATGSGSGWKLQAAIGTLQDTSSTPVTIPASGHKITGVSLSATTGTPPTNSASTAQQIPTSAGTIYNAAANTGMGRATITFATSLDIPAQQKVGTGSFSSTLTLTLASGPN